MTLRTGINAHWVGATHYVGREHAGGVVITGPMPLPEAINRVLQMERDGLNAATAQDTYTRAAWFVIAIELLTRH